MVERLLAMQKVEGSIPFTRSVWGEGWLPQQAKGSRLFRAPCEYLAPIEARGVTSASATTGDLCGCSSVVESLVPIQIVRSSSLLTRSN